VFRLNGHQAHMTAGDVSVSNVREKKDSGMREFLLFTRSTYVEEALVGPSGYNPIDCRLLSVWREELGTSAEVRFGKLSATVNWDDDAANNGVLNLLHLLNATQLDWFRPIDEFVAKAKDE
ncbi:hypothetical protein AAVH_32794, partial [Aphelenchoides avenae]